MPAQTATFRTNTPPTPRELLREGIKHAREGNKPLARLALRHVVSADPENATAWLWLASVVLDGPESLDCLRRVLLIDPDNSGALAALPTALTRVAIASAQQGDKPAARSLLREAVERDPKNELAWLWSAGVAGSAEDAERCLREVLAINPSNERARQGLAQYAKQKAAALRCPICDSREPAAAGCCPVCRAVLTLSDPHRFDSPTGADPHHMEPAIKRYREKFEVTGSPDHAFIYALACLNSGQRELAGTALEQVAQHPATDPARRELAAGYVRYLAERLAAEAPCVMIVDDSPTVRKLVAFSLEPAGYRVVPVADGSLVLDAVREHGVPDLFILDINMPGMDGFQVCKALRATRATAKIPCVFLTGKDGTLTKLRARWVGAAEFLVKPFEPQALVKVVNALVAANQKSPSGR